MNYSQNELLELMDEVLAQDGEHLDRECVTREFDFTGDIKLPEKDRVLPYCGHPTIFSVPYSALDVKGNEVGRETVEVCAVDDNMAMWPRFGGDRFAAIFDAANGEG